MAKPIEPLPILEGKDAEKFLEDLNRPEQVTEQERKFFKEVKELK